MSVTENRANIRANRRKIFELENAVLNNRKLAYQTRALITENASTIRKNYDAAFMGNRQLANMNTDDIFRNRTAIARNIATKSDVELNFKEVTINKVRLEFLDHRSKLNERVLSVSEELARINRELINVNRTIMDSNENIVNFNAQLIEDNRHLLQSGVDASKATPQSNAQLIAANKAKIEEIASRAASNKERLQKLLSVTSDNRTSISANAAAILERRKHIAENGAAIAANQKRVAEFISHA